MIRTLGCLPALIRPPFRCSTVPLQARARNGTTTATLRVIYPATNLGPGRATQHPRPLHRLERCPTRSAPAVGGEQRPLLDPALGAGAQSRFHRALAQQPPAARRPGRLATATVRCCWRPSCSPTASPVPATAPPTGPTSVRPKAAANSTCIVPTRCPGKTSGSTRSGATSAADSAPRSILTPTSRTNIYWIRASFLH